MSGKLEVRLDRRDWEALDALCAERRVSRSALVRSLIHAARNTGAPPRTPGNPATAVKASPTLTAATAPSPRQSPLGQRVLPASPVELHEALRLPPPTPSQAALYAGYPHRRGRLGDATVEELQAGWLICLADPSARTILFAPDEDVGRRSLQLLVNALRPLPGLAGPLRERIPRLPFSTEVPSEEPRRWVTVGMPADGAYPEWFRRGFS